MSAKRPDPDCANAYKAADLWIDRALKSDDSLFTPGTPIWSLAPLAEARALLVNNARTLRVADSLFLGKLERVMAGSSPELYQLMGEAAYVAYLILWKSAVVQDRKIENINRILGWSSKRVRMPHNLHAGLENGIMSPGKFIYFDLRLDAVIKFAERWKRAGSNAMLDRRHPEYPRRFQEFLARLKVTSAWQVAPLHLVHPESFEPLVWSNKVCVASAPKFQRYVTGIPAKEVDRRIHRIRAALESQYGCCFDFHGHPEVRRMWEDDCKK